VSPDGQQAYVANEGTAQLQIVSLSTGVTSSVPLGAAPFDLQLSPDASQVWLGLFQTGQVLVIDRTSRAVIRTITTGGVPQRMAFPSSGLLVVANRAGWIDFLR
jgi:DNA-binding beta-propeller fold protein YncE